MGILVMIHKLKVNQSHSQSQAITMIKTKNNLLQKMKDKGRSQE